MEKDIRHIPLPTEVPRPPDLSSLPPEILRSNTVETLIAQNEDLMARLKVNLRRNALLEQEIENIAEETKEMKLHLQSTGDQILVYKEKDQAWDKKLSSYEEKIEQTREDLQLAELRYAELFETFKEKESFFIEGEGKLNLQLERYQRYHAKIRKNIRPWVNQLQNHNQFLTAQVDESERKQEGHLQLIKDLRQKISELSQHIKNQSHNHTRERTQLLDLHEQEKSQLSQRVDVLQVRNSDLEAEVSRLIHLDSEIDQVKNESICYKRAKEEIQTKLNEELARTQEKMTFYRSDAKRITLERDTHKEENTRLEEKNSELLEKVDQLTSQLESLRTLWTDQNQKFEKAKQQNESLESLNSELSKQMRDQRQKMTQLEIQIDFMKKGSKAPLSPPVETPSKETPSTEGRTQSFERIESLLTEIQSGFERSIE